VKRYESPAGWIVQAYRFALNPADAQVAGLRRNTGGARFAYNHMLRRVSAVKAQRAAETSYGVPESDLTPWQGWSLPDLRRTWNEIKQWVAPWWAQCSKEAFNTGLANLSAASKRWQRSQRTMAKVHCGLSLDRDVNAARNLAALARHADPELPGDAKTGRGAHVGPVRPASAGGAAGREASRPSRVNAARQRTAADHELTKVH
jgi:transposase